MQMPTKLQFERGWALLLPLIILSGPTSLASAQQSAVQGVIIDQATTQPLLGATVLLERGGQQLARGGAQVLPALGQGLVRAGRGRSA